MYTENQTHSTLADEPSIGAGADTNTSNVSATAPGQLRVIKRNGTIASYDASKVSVAMTKAFLAVEGGTAAASGRVHETVQTLTDQITATFKRRMPSGGTIHIEEIQDQVELALMRSGEHKVARDYVLYREGRARQRAEKLVEERSQDPDYPALEVTLEDGSRVPLDIQRLRTIVSEACADLTGVSDKEILDEAMRNLYQGVNLTDVNTSLVITARTLVEKEPNYSYATARLLLDKLRAEALGFLGIAESATQADMTTLYAKALPAYIQKGVELELLSPELLNFDRTQLGQALLPERDLQFNYLGLQTLYDRYFIHSGETRIELPQIFFMRVALGLAVEEEDRKSGVE